MYSIPCVDSHRCGCRGTSGWTAYLYAMDVAVLKGFSNGETLSRICGVSRKTVHYWVDVFLDHASNLNLVS